MPPRSSVRLVRNRQAALRDYTALARAPLTGGVEGFRRGYEFIRRDIIAGWTPDESFDLASTVKGAGAAFMDGANAARHLFGGHRAYAEKLAKAYKAVLP